MGHEDPCEALPIILKKTTKIQIQGPKLRPAGRQCD